MRPLLRLLAQFAVPIALLAVAFALVFTSAELPPSLSGLKDYGPYIVFVLGAALATAFRRGRALLALIVLVIAYWAQQDFLQAGLGTPVAHAVFAGLALFVPLNLGLLAVLPERGVFNHHSALRLGVIGLQVAFVAWSASSGEADAIDWAYRNFLDPAPFSIGRIPQPGIVMVSLGLLAAMANAALTRSAISAGLAGAIVAYTIAAHVPTASVTYSIFTAMAELMVAIAVLQDTFRMAFRDELTGIPSRRALNEQLAALGKDYAVAMVDVDHFKKFNDTYGHDLGDQVLKMVAAHIADVGGGGKAFRYGGEEFTILFAGKDMDHAIPHLETLREEIESYRLALRSGERPKKAKGDKRQRGGWRGRDAVSVTVSIGVAERDERFVDQKAVVAAADRALYRAKSKGRNRVSR